jgi:peptidoglycan/xylan/chitin deacetylase (PgdA/CDA1 family)
LQTFDIFTLSSLWEGLPIVILEAMAAEKPVVATAVDGVAEVVEHDKTGLLIEPQRPDLLAKSVIELIRNPNRAKGMGKRGRERLERSFSINRVINTVEQIYLSQMLNKMPSKYDWLKIYVKRIYSTLLYIGRQRSWENEDGVMALFYHSLDSGKPMTNFLKQIDYLERHGYKVVPVNDIISYVRGEKTLTPRSVCLTFDDGYSNNYGVVFTILKKYDVPVTIFLSTKYVTSDDSQEIDLGISERFLSWGEIKEMARGGVCFGSHGHNHCDLTSLSEDKSLQEILLSKELIRKNLSGRIRYFSYPYGRYDRKTLQLVKKVGFEAAFTTIPGTIRPGDDPYALKRTLIAPSDSLFDFKKKIAGIFV